MTSTLTSSLHQCLSDLGRIKDEEIRYSEAGLYLAAVDRPAVDLEPYRRHLEALVTEVAEFADIERQPTSLSLKAEALIQVINRRYGYGGSENSSQELEGLSLMRMIDNRCGASATLALLFLHVASELGWRACGINFPGCFLVLLTEDSSRLIIDPYSGDLVQTQDLRSRLKTTLGNDAELSPEHYQELPRRGILLHLLGQIKIHHIITKHFDQAKQTLAIMLMIAPEETELWRETGMLNAHTKNTPEAIIALETYLDKTGGGVNQWTDGRDTVTKLLHQLKNSLN